MWPPRALVVLWDPFGEKGLRGLGKLCFGRYATQTPVKRIAKQAPKMRFFVMWTRTLKNDFLINVHLHAVQNAENKCDAYDDEDSFLHAYADF